MIKQILYLLIIFLLVVNSASGKTIDALKASPKLGYLKADRVREFEFPRDHGPHEGFQTEWWYFTGNLLDKKGREFGYQLTIFRNNISPDFNDHELKTKQIYMGHFAISDIKRSKFYSSEIFQRGAAGLAGANNKVVWINDWQIDFEKMKISANQSGIAIDLYLKNLKNIVLQGDRGLSQKSTEIGNASYYYSFTRLESQGEITIGDENYKVTGLSWMDREWSTSALGADQEGWDWFSLQLSDDTDLMYYQLREKDGIGKHSQGSFVDQESKKRIIKKEDIVVQVLDYWVSPETKIKYPSKWQIDIAKEKLSLTITAKIKNQEHLFSYSYWEGAVSITGVHNSKKLTGNGYVELTGYK